MPQTSPSPDCNASLWKRRVLYPTADLKVGEGFVTLHDRATRTVIVLDIVDGTFWRGADDDVEIIV
jgi:hypothetical protein